MKLDSMPARPLTDREVAKLLCSTMGAARSFGTDPDAIGRALEWCHDNWHMIRPALGIHTPPHDERSAPERT